MQATVRIAHLDHGNVAASSGKVHRRSPPAVDLVDACMPLVQHEVHVLRGANRDQPGPDGRGCQPEGTCRGGRRARRTGLVCMVLTCAAS